MNYKLKRFLGFGIDIAIIALIIILLSFISEEFIKNNSFYIAYPALLLKDVFNKNGSIGKSILGLKLVTNNKLHYIKVILRNLTLIVWPIEAIVLLFSNKRIGDYILKSNVIEKSSNGSPIVSNDNH